MEGHRPTDHFVVLYTAEVCPRAVKFNRFVKGYPREVCRKGADALGRNAATVCHRLGGIFIGQIAVSHLVEHGAVGDAFGAVRAGQIRLYAFAIPRCQLPSAAVNDLRLTVRVAQEQAEFIGFGILVH